MPYELPKDESDAQDLANGAKEIWQSGRNKRFEEDQQLYEQQGVTTVRDVKTRLEREALALADGTAEVLKAVAILGSREPEISLAAPTTEAGPLVPVAQAGENWLRSWRRRLTMRYQEQVTAPLIHDECWWICGTGWLVPVLMMDPRDEARKFPFYFKLIDPYDCYPAAPAGVPDVIVHAYSPTIAEVKAGWSKRAQTIVGDTRRYGTVDYVGFYTPTETAELLDGQWLKRPTRHGYSFNPCHPILAQGAPYQARNQANSDWTRFRGQGLLSALRQQVRNKEDLMTMGRTVVAKLAAPPTMYFSHTGEAPEGGIPTQPGEVGTGQQGEVLGQYGPPPAALQGVEHLLAALQRTIDMTGIGPAAWAGGEGDSGVSDREQTQNALDILLSYLTAMKGYYLWLYSHALELFALTGQPMNVLAMDNGQPIFGELFTPEMVPLLDLDIGLDVRFKSLDQRNRFVKAQMATNLVNANLISPDTARDELLEIANPTAEENKIILAMARRDPMFVRLRGYKMVAETSTDETERAIATDMYDSTLQAYAQQQAQRAMGLPASGQGGPPGLPSGAQPPPPGAGVPSAAIPPAEMAYAGVPPEMQLAAAAPNGAAPPGGF